MATGKPQVRVFGPEYRRLTVGIVAAVVFIAFEAMAVATAMPRAVSDLDGMNLYALGFSAFFTTSLVGMVLSGETCDRSGPLRPIVGGALLFSAGLVLDGVAQTMWPFIAGRAVQGLGGGLVIVALYVVVGRAYPGGARPKVFAAMSAAWVVPSIVGPLVSGLLADHLSWRWVFLGIAPLVLVPIVMVLPSIRAVDGPPAFDASEGSAVAPGSRPRRTGIAIVTAVGMALLQYAGTHPGVTAILVAVAGIALAVPTVPRLLPRGTLRLRRGLPTVVAMRGVLAGAFFGAETFLPLMLITERGVSSTLAGLALTGGALGWSTGSWYQGRNGTVIPRHRLVQIGSGMVGIAITALSLVLLPVVPFWIAALTWMFGAIGMGMAMSSLSVLLFQLSPVSEQGQNSAAMQLSDALFTIVFVGLAGTIFGSGHGGDATPGESVVPSWVFLVILGAMAGLAFVGSWAAGRIAIRGSGRAAEGGVGGGG